MILWLQLNFRFMFMEMLTEMRDNSPAEERVLQTWGNVPRQDNTELTSTRSWVNVPSHKFAAFRRPFSCSSRSEHGTAAAERGPAHVRAPAHRHGARTRGRALGAATFRSRPAARRCQPATREQENKLQRQLSPTPLPIFFSASQQKGRAHFRVFGKMNQPQGEP